MLDLRCSLRNAFDFGTQNGNVFANFCADAFVVLGYLLQGYVYQWSVNRCRWLLFCCRDTV
jgi:hypothetical protein